MKNMINTNYYPLRYDLAIYVCIYCYNNNYYCYRTYMYILQYIAYILLL